MQGTQANLMDLVPDHHNRGSIKMMRVTQIPWFPSTYKLYLHYTVVYKCATALCLKKCTYLNLKISSVQSLSHVQLCNPMDCSTPGFPVDRQLPEFTHTHVHRVGDAIQPSHPLWSPFPPAFHLSQHQSLFQLVSSSHQVAKVLELQLQHQSFQ